MARKGRFGSEDAVGLRRILGGTDEGRGVILKGGEGWIDVDDDDEVHIAIVFDVQGYGPHIGAIYADQNRYHASSDTALQAAYEILEEEMRDSADPEYIKELEEEWGDEWHSVFTETIDGQTWTLSPRDAFKAIRGTDAMDYITVQDEDGEELSGAEGDWAWTTHQQIFIPDRQIKKDNSEYVYVPVRGYSGSLAVFDIDDKVIGWIDTRTLGYDNTKAWIRGTKWRDQGSY